ncbi:MAG: HIT family protein [Candidatus Nanohaloarchaea archaeon]
MPPQGDQCPFCQLISNPDQLLLVGESENFYAWLEINPRARGHTMVVPKDHVDSVMNLSPGEYSEAMELAREAAKKAEEGLGADGASITMNIGETGGQMVDHAYIQVFPRFEDEETAGTPTGAIFQPKEDLQDELQEIQSSMESVDVSFGEATIEPHPDSQKFREEDEDPREPEQEDEGEEEKDSGGRRRRSDGSMDWD